MILKNLTYYDENFQKQTGDIVIENGKFAALGKTDAPGLDMQACTAVPGFIDTHIHGAAGGDFCDCSAESLQKIAAYLAKNGVTAFCPTTMTLGEEALTSILSLGARCAGTVPGARVLGFHLEGPFIALSKKGAQNPAYVRPGTSAEFDRLNDASGGRVKIITMAPEAFDSRDFITHVCTWAHVSVGHTAASYEEAAAAYRQGADRATHLFNAMTPLQHRAPGVVGAALENDSVFCELICDGYHLAPAVVRTVFKTLGRDRAVVVSDSMKAAGLAPGKYDLGGQDVFVDEKQDVARLGDGTIAASITNVFQEFKNLLSFGIDFETALRACTINPARSVGCDAFTGSIAVGKDADLVILNDCLEIEQVYIKGERYGG